MPYFDQAVPQKNSARIYFEDSGGNGPPVVFSHGILMDREMWIPQVEALRSEFRCIVWDERAHGLTEFDGAFTYWDSAADVLALLDHLSIDHAFLVGMSQGGYLSLRAALLGPERIQGLVLIDSQATIEDPELRPGYDAMLEQLKASGVSRDLAGAVAAIILGGDIDPEPWIEKWLGAPVDRIIAAYGALMEREDISDRLDEIKAPALVIHGEADVAIALDRAERMAEGLANCDGFVRIPGASHTANLSHPGVVNEAIRDFLRRHTV